MPFTLSMADKVRALREMHAKNLHHYDAGCPHCGRVNAISRERLETFTSGWKQAVKKPESQPSARTGPAAFPEGTQSRPIVDAADQSLQDCFNFDDADLGANRFGTFSNKQQARLIGDNLHQRKSNRTSGIILLAIGVVGSMAAIWLFSYNVSRWILYVLLQAVIFGAGKLWESFSNTSTQFNLAKAEGLAVIETSGPTPLIPYNDYYRDLYIGRKKFRADRGAAGAIKHGYEYAVYYCAVREDEGISAGSILSAELLSQEEQRPSRATIQDLLLKDYFEFDEDDLRSNRAGQLSDRQRTRRNSVSRSDNEFALLIGMQCIVVAAILAFRVIRDPAGGVRVEMGDGTAQIAGLLLVGCGILLLAYQYLLPVRFRIPHRQARVASVQGSANIFQPEHRSIGTPTYSPYELHIGKLKFSATLRLRNLMHGATYIVYYIDGSRDIVAVEPVPAAQ